MIEPEEDPVVEAYRQAVLLSEGVDPWTSDSDERRAAFARMAQRIREAPPPPKIWEPEAWPNLPDKTVGGWHTRAWQWWGRFRSTFRAWMLGWFFAGAMFGTLRLWWWGPS